jgi:thymidylate synthase
MNYINLINNILTEGQEELNLRTGQRTKRIIGAVIDLWSKDEIFSPRKLSPKIAAAEVAWMLSGETSTEWLSKHTKIWKKFEDDKNPGNISSAYGYRWRHLFQRDQIQEAIGLLKKDSSTRQALVMSWDPMSDGLMNQGLKKNVPCPFAFSLYTVADKGYLVVYQRSADAVVGIPYDLMAYFMLGQAIFNSVGAQFEGVRIMIGDAHIYENHWNVASQIVDSKCPNFYHRLDHPFHVEDILQEPDLFVSAIAEQWDGVEFAISEKLEAAQ